MNGCSALSDRSLRNVFRTVVPEALFLSAIAQLVRAIELKVRDGSQLRRFRSCGWTHRRYPSNVASSSTTPLFVLLSLV